MPKLINPLKGLVDYVNDIKPYHTKILEVLIEYVYQDRIKAIVIDNHTLVIDTTFPEANLTQVNPCGGYDSMPYDSTGRHILITPSISEVTTFAYDSFSYDTQPYEYVTNDKNLIDTIDNTILVLGDRTNDMVVGSKISLYSYIEDYTGTWSITDVNIIDNSFYLDGNLTQSLKIGERFVVNDSNFNVIHIDSLLQANDISHHLHINGDITQYLRVGQSISISNSINAGVFTVVNYVYHILSDKTVITTQQPVILNNTPESNVQFIFPITNNGNYIISGIVYHVIEDKTELKVDGLLKTMTDNGYMVFEKYTLVLPTPENNGLFTIEDTQYIPSMINSWPGYPNIDFPNYIVGDKEHTIVKLLEPLDPVPTTNFSRKQLYITSFVFDKIKIHNVLPYSRIISGKPNEGYNYFTINNSVLTTSPNSGGFVIRGDISGSNIRVGDSFRVSNISGLNGFYTIYSIAYELLSNQTTILTTENITQIYDIINVPNGLPVGKVTFDIISNAFVIEGNYVGRFHQGYTFNVFGGDYSGNYTTLHSDYYNGYTRIRVSDTIAPFNIGAMIENITINSPTTSSIIVYGDQRAYFNNKPNVFIIGSSGNNGSWEIIDVVYDNITHKSEILINGTLDITAVGGKVSSVLFGYIEEHIHGYDEQPSFCKVTQSTLIHVKIGETLHIKGRNMQLHDDIIAYNLENTNTTGYEFPINTIISPSSPPVDLPTYIVGDLNEPVLDEISLNPVMFNEMSSHIWQNQDHNMYITHSITPDLIPSGLTFHVHTQHQYQTVWIITHNLQQKYVAVRVVDEVDSEIYPSSIHYNTQNELEVTFTSPSIGRVICFADGDDWQLRNQYYLYEANVPTTSWNITHTLNQKYVNVTIVDDNDYVFLPTDIEYIDNFNLVVSFTTPHMGKAILLGDDDNSTTVEDYFLYEQLSGDNQWIINHNLNQQYVIVTIVDDNDNVKLPLYVEYLTPNQLVVYFSTNETGKAIVLGKEIKKEHITHKRITTGYWVDTTTNTFYYRTAYSIRQNNGDINSPYIVIDSGWDIFTDKVPGFNSIIKAIPKTYLYETETQLIQTMGEYNNLPNINIELMQVELPYIIDGFDFIYKYELFDITVNSIKADVNILTPTTFTIVYPIPDIGDDVVVKIYKDDRNETNAYVSPYGSVPHINLHTNVDLYSPNCIQLYGGNYINHLCLVNDLVAIDGISEIPCTIRYINTHDIAINSYTLVGDFTWLFLPNGLFRAYSNDLIYWDDYTVVNSIFDGVYTIIETINNINPIHGLIFGVVYIDSLMNDDVSTLVYVNQTIPNLTHVRYYHNYFSMTVSTSIDDNTTPDDRTASSTVTEQMQFEIISSYDFDILNKDYILNTLYVDGDITNLLLPSTDFAIVGSTINDGIYSVDSISYDSLNDTTEVQANPIFNGDDMFYQNHETYYLYENSIPSVQWSINHNLNQKYVIVTVVDDNDIVFNPLNIEYVDENNLIVHFTTNKTGKAIVVGEEVIAPTNNDNYFIFEQTTLDTTWVVNHTLDENYVSVLVLDDNDSILFPLSIVFVSNNQLIVSFTNAKIGKVVCVGGRNNVPIGTRYYLHEQTILDSTWNINHNMGTKYTNITVINDNNFVFIPYEIEYVDENNTTIHFNSDYIGKVVIIGDNLHVGTEGKIEFTKIENIVVI
jgi:hypothetical protein